MARLVPLHLHDRPRSRSRWRVLLCLLALAVVASVGLPSVSPAQADEPFPATPRFGPAIDAYPAYEPETGCHAGVQPGILSLVSDTLRPAYGGTAGEYLTERACGERSSGHEEGRALDWMVDARVPAQYATAKAFLDWLLATDEHGNRHAMARRLGVTYVLYNNQMWRAYRADEGWMPQRFAGADCATLDSSYATKCHRDHIHLSMSWSGALKKTSYWTAQLPPPPAGVLPGTLGAYPGDGVVKLARTNDAVLRYERRLQALGLLSASAVNGTYGDVTDTATRTLQKRTGLVVDGVVGPKTWAAADRATVASLASTAR